VAESELHWRVDQLEKKYDRLVTRVNTLDRTFVPRLELERDYPDRDEVEKRANRSINRLLVFATIASGTAAIVTALVQALHG
jgi:tetrahydromethanopterin S-methyltransferase subunit B